MKRIISLIIILSLSVCIFCSCGATEDAEDSDRVMYGVVVRLPDTDRNCLFFDGTGHVTAPRLANGAKSPELELGHLVRVEFSCSVRDIPIMESFPGQFGAEAVSVELKADSVAYSVSDYGRILTAPTPSDLSVSAGDNVSILFSDGDGDTLLGTAQVVLSDSQVYAVKLGSNFDASRLFEALYHGKLKVVKK